jgi:hypothetical protein
MGESPPLVERLCHEFASPAAFRIPAAITGRRGDPEVWN